MQPIDQGSILRSGAAVVPDFANQMLQRQQMQLMQREQAMQGQQFQLKQAQDQRKLAEEASYEAAMQEYLADPKPEKLIGLMAQYPDRHEGLKKAYDASKGEAAANDLQQSVEVYSLAKNGRIDKASERLKARIAADEAAGMDVSQDREVLAMLQDPETQKQALGLMEMSVALAMGQDKFTDTFKALNPDEKMSPFMREYNDRVAKFGKRSADAWRAVQDEKFVPVDGIGVFRGSDLLTGGIVATQSQQDESERLAAMFPDAPLYADDGPLPNIGANSGGQYNRTKGGGQASTGSRASIYAITEEIESGGNPNAVSPKGARGPMQTMPYTLTDPGFGVQPARNNSVDEMRRVGRDYLDAMISRYGGDMRKAWAAYNWGPGNLEKAIARHGNGWLSKAPAETRAYVAKAMSKLGKSGSKPVSKKVSGKTYYEIDGKWYDNPEGK